MGKAKSVFSISPTLAEAEIKKIKLYLSTQRYVTAWVTGKWKLIENARYDDKKQVIEVLLAVNKSWHPAVEFMYY